VVKIGNSTLPEFPLLLAPMEDVSDPPFRAVCKDQGADLLYTEFISIESLVRGAIKSRKKLDIFEAERPVGIQVFGGDEDSMAMAAGIVEAANPDLLDINFGCPVKGIVGPGTAAGRAGGRGGGAERYRSDGPSDEGCGGCYPSAGNSEDEAGMGRRDQKY
jgi:tRNA-dihydrouridine synthase B